MESNITSIELHDKENKLYELKIYIQKDVIVLETEIDSGKYTNQLSLEELQNMNRYFNQSNNLENAIDDLSYLFENEYSIEENEETITFIIKYRKDLIKFVLDKIEDKIDLSYDSLPDQMKEIIDDNQLVLGIDLGTTYSCAAVMIDKNIIMIRNSLGSTTTPSYISFVDTNEVYVGELSKLLPSDEKNIIFNTKRLLGKNIEDNEIKEIIPKLPFKLKKDEKFNLLKICLNFKDTKNEEEKNKEEEFYPEQLSALILRKIINDSEFYLSKKIGRDIKIKNCVITVPAYFNQKQRESTLNSAKILGLNVRTMINEPTAASLAYAFQSLENADKKIIVIDFGGGTLDITLLRYRKDKDAIYCDVKFTYGNTNFGGEDFDIALMNKCEEKCINSSNDTNDTKNKKISEKNDINNHNIIRLKRACERAKIKLSSFDSTKIHIENYFNYQGIDFPITKSEFNDYCKPLFEKFEQILKDFIEKANIKNNDDIFEIILIGGSSIIPKIREIIKEKFKKSFIKYDLDPKEVVARGAAIRGGKFLNLPSVSDIKLFDVTNLSLGIKLKDNKFSKIIPRSTLIPYQNKNIFYTTEDNQTNALIEVYEGEEEKNCDEKNLLLGNFEIIGLPKRKAGKVKIEVKIEIKENSTLEISALDIDNDSNCQKITINKLNDLPSIMKELQERENNISFFGNYKYNQIKFEIIKYEEELTKQKSKKVLNQENIKKIFIKIIETIGNFLINYDYFSNLYVSFIKYYFNIICHYFQIYTTENMEKIKETIPKLFLKVQFYNSDLIYEIMEEYVDVDNVYNNFIDLIIQSLWEDINTIFIMTKKYDNNEYAKVLDNLSQAQSKADVCIKMIDKFDPKKIKLNNITKTDIENIKLKIEVRENIIKEKNKYFFQKIFSSDAELKQLYNKYKNIPNVEKDELKELGNIIGIRDSNNNNNINGKNFDKEWDIAEKFIKWINGLNNDDTYTTINEILYKYPYEKDKIKRELMWNEFYKFKSHQKSQDEYLLLIKGKYLGRLEQNDVSEVEGQVFQNILEYLNKL